jgi:hypothetical protein
LRPLMKLAWRWSSLVCVISATNNVVIDNV